MAYRNIDNIFSFEHIILGLVDKTKLFTFNIKLFFIEAKIRVNYYNRIIIYIKKRAL